MVSVFLFLLFLRLGLGELLCFDFKAPLGKPGILTWPAASNLRVWCHHRSDCNHAGAGQCGAGLRDGMIGATILEYFTGALMESLFHVRYWDYSNHRFI